MNFLKFVLIGFLLFSSTASWAAIAFSPTLFYSQEEDDDDGSTSEEKLTIYDIKLGYVTGNNIWVGAIYAHENEDHVTSETDITAVGVSLGYFQVGWFILGHYFFDTERETSGSNTTETGDKGHQVDVGYLFSAGSVNVGPQLSYKKYFFDEESPGGDVDRSKMRLIPMVNLTVLF